MDDFNNVPLVKAKTHIRELKSIHINNDLPFAPASIVTEEGEFRIPKDLWVMAKQAAAVPSYDGPLDGPLGSLLHRIARAAGDEGATKESDTTDSPRARVENQATDHPESDPLGGLARRLAREALQELQRRTDDAVKDEFKHRRAEIMRNALESINLLDLD